MKKVDQEILNRLKELIKTGESVTGTMYRRDGKDDVHSQIDSLPEDYQVNCEAAHQWGTSCLNILRRVFGIESDHYKKFNALFDEFHDYVPVAKALGVLEAAKEDYEKDFLFDTRALIEAEVFDDFLGQAEYLLSSGYYQSAAVIAGSVLEDGLRKLCMRNRIALPERPKLDQMNADLAKQGIYNKLLQKRITVLVDVRNKAAHGRWNEFSKEDVEDMIHHIRQFMETHF